MVLSTTGGCRADIHSPTHVSVPKARLAMSRAKYQQEPVDLTWAVLLATRDGAIPLSHELGSRRPGGSWPGDAMHGGCRADIHSTTHAQARHVMARISAGPVDATWAVLLAARDGAIPLSHELGTRLASPTIISTVGEWPLYGCQSISPSCIASGRR